MTELTRSFIAVPVPPEVVEKLRAAQERLRSACADVKWVSPDGFHITLKFLGGVERERLDAVWRDVSHSLTDCRAFAMQFRGVGAFPSPTRARVIWAGVVEGAAELEALAERVEQACTEHGFERENRPFQAHLTLGRVRDPGPAPELAAAMGELSEADLGQARVDRVLLMRSELTRQGAIYHELEQRELKGEGESDG